MEGLNESLFNCPISFEIPEKEVFQCQNGHTVCSICLSKNIQKCPECRVPLSSGNAVRNRQLEAILDAMTFHCPQKSKGCSEKLKRADLTSHVNGQCKFTRTSVKHIETFDGLVPGTKISISGKTWVDADRFTINLCESEKGRILMHFDARFDPPYAKPDASVVVRNTSFLGGWGHEERFSPSFPFARNNAFKIDIWCELDCFHVAVDGKSFVDYQYRLPLNICRCLKISGTVNVSFVDIK